MTLWSSTSVGQNQASDPFSHLPINALLVDVESAKNHFSDFATLIVQCVCPSVRVSIVYEKMNCLQTDYGL
jgi:hypothetical protein